MEKTPVGDGRHTSVRAFLKAMLFTLVGIALLALGFFGAWWMYNL